jgi:hypothetical protein
VKSEKSIEAAVTKYAKAQGCLCYKFVSPSNRGVPDRIIIGPTGKVLFLELKAPGKVPTPLQIHVITQLRDNGANADWADSAELAKDLIDTFVLRGNGKSMGLSAKVEVVNRNGGYYLRTYYAVSPTYLVKYPDMKAAHAAFREHLEPRGYYLESPQP